MKFAMVTTYATPTNVRRELLAAIRAKGHEVTVIAPEPENVMGPALAPLGVEYKAWRIGRTRIAPLADLRAGIRLQSLLRRGGYDVVMCYQIKAVLLTPLAARTAGVRRTVVLVNGLGTVFDEDGYGATLQARAARLAYRASIRGADLVIFHNRDDAQHLVDLGTLRRDAAWRVVSGSGIDLAAFTPALPWRTPPTFTLTARLLGAKGIREFVSAARLVKLEYPHARFVLAGQLEREHPDGISPAEVTSWSSAGTIDYVGFVRNVRGLLGASTVYVLPSYREGMPRTNLEAMAMGLPVVTTNVSGCRETVVEGVNGFLVPPRDPEALANALKCYLADPSLAQRHGSQSQAIVRRFAIEAINEQMLDALGLG